MPEKLYGYSETYRPLIDTFRRADPEIINAVLELVASGCICCPADGKFPNLCLALLDEKRRAA